MPVECSDEPSPGNDLKTINDNYTGCRNCFWHSIEDDEEQNNEHAIRSKTDSCLVLGGQVHENSFIEFKFFTLSFPVQISFKNIPGDLS